MSLENPPSVGDWYKDRSGETFEVVAMDEEAGTVEVQYFDGTVEELDLDNWHEIHPVPVEAPEDWSGSLDITREDYGVDLDDPLHSDWQNPLDELDL